MVPCRELGPSLSSFRSCAMFAMIGVSAIFLLTIALIVIRPRGLDEAWAALIPALVPTVIPRAWK